MMPKNPVKPCKYPGCSSLVDQGYCDSHKGMAPVVRDAPTQGLYGTRRWKSIRVLQLAKEPWCAECLRANIYTPATDVDHVERHHGDPIKFFFGKRQSLCHSCHSRKTAGEVGFSSEGRGAEKVFTRGSNSAQGHPYEINSQCGEFS
jgi:5-methylcytosine-specific restriction protein A